MDILIDIIFDLLFDGLAEAAASPRFPRWVRILCGVLLLAGAALVSGAILYIGIKDRNILICIVGVILALIFLTSFFQAWQKSR
ncbi:MAG: hypothetical protein IKG46_14440 [Solobacterium sp.]|nr:hypothetical protein [Solobacterium sp.]